MLLWGLSILANIRGGISDNPLAALGPSFALNYAGVIFFSCLGALLMTSLVYAMVRLYNEREERLNGIVFGDIKSLLLRNIKRLFLMGIACSFLFIFAVVIVVLLAVLTPFTLILTIPLLFAFMVPLALMAPIYLFEDISLGEAFAKTFRGREMGGSADTYPTDGRDRGTRTGCALEI